MSQLNEKPQKPWYKQFWPWFLLSIPIASIILSTIMVTVAIRGRDTVVVDNYYKEGRMINEALGRDHFARELGLGAEVMVTEDAQVTVTLYSEQDIAPDYLTLKLFHPTMSGRDQSVKLEPGANREFFGRLTGELSGRWYVDVVDDQDLWRLKGEIRLPQSSPLALGNVPAR